jgi:tRNA dimethylallyltransferase
VVAATGRPLAAWQRGPGPTPPLRAAAILLLPPRAGLYAACDARFAAMMEQGAEREVAVLLARRLDPALPAMKAVGVRELGAFLNGQGTRADAVAAAQQATRRYAKRQFTWFRHQLQETPSLRRRVIGEQFSESLLSETLSFIRQSLLTIKI